ncbi:hypothetical protein IMSAG013_00600 [Clostridiales bacterium]|nr:hypothetical protein IMSAG013_00600 [Clostridiales bacterium]
MIKNISEAVAYLRSMSPIWRDLQEGKKSYVIQ